MLNHLPALTGVRFLAAFTVAIAHGTLVLVAGHGQLPGFAIEVVNLPALGMSLFFVLSGFVIHYTYAESLKQPYGQHNFLVARFARLYPLYIALFLMELSDALLFRKVPPFGFDWRALPFYLTLTQSWWYAILNERSLVYQFGSIAQLTWSISTELWLYFAYLVLVTQITRLNTVKSTVIAWVAWCTIAICVVLLAGVYRDAISEDAGRLFGEIADGRESWTAQDSFFRWLVYFSPYSRIGDFLSGCLAAHAYVLLSRKPASVREQRLGSALSWLAIAGIAGTHWLVFMRGPIAGVSQYFLHMSAGFAPSCALLIFAAARYHNSVTRVLSLRPVVALGEASYSIYLLHMAFFLWFSSGPPQGSMPVRVAKLVAVILLLFGVSRVTYLTIERPARHWLRKRLSIVDRPANARVLQPGRVQSVAWVILFVPVAFATFAWTKERFAPLDQALHDSKPGEAIKVVSAAYGRNCTDRPVNAELSVRRRCEGRRSCDYVVSVATLGDPAPGCAKDFHIAWQCSGNSDVLELLLPPEAGLRSVAQLQCNERILK